MARKTKKTEANSAPAINPDAPSISYTLSLPSWTRINDIVGGADTVRAKREVYLPKFPGEEAADYDARLAITPFTNHFLDLVLTVCAKPFEKEVLIEDVSPQLKEILKDIDGRGTSIHAFVRETYRRGALLGRHYLLADHPPKVEGATLADERRAGARPYLVHIRADDMLMFATERVDGRDVCTYARWKETFTERDGFEESEIERIREIARDAATGHVTWRVFDKIGEAWEETDTGDYSLPEIAIAVFETGEVSDDGKLKPPFEDLAELQFQHYRNEGRLDNILEFAGFPMLTGNGVSLPTDDKGDPIPLKVGPRAVLIAPVIPGATTATGSWAFIEPNGSSIEKIESNLQRIESAMNKLGMAPLVRQSGSVTATSDSIADARAHSRASAWAVDLETVINQALMYMEMWLGTDKDSGKTTINTDFGIEGEGEAAFDMLLKMRATGDLTRETLLKEAKRRSILGPRFKIEEELDRLEVEGTRIVPDEDDPNDEIDPEDDPTNENREPQAA